MSFAEYCFVVRSVEPSDSEPDIVPLYRGNEPPVKCADPAEAKALIAPPDGDKLMLDAKLPLAAT